MSLVIGILTFVLIITSLFLVLVVLMQRAKSDAGMGSAMGGSSMESTFGAETGNVLSGATIKASIVFFVVSFTLYLAHIYQSKHHDAMDNKLPTIVQPASSTTPAGLLPAPSPATSSGPSATKTPASNGPVAVPVTGSSGPVPQPSSQPVEPAKK
jgi:preprotein translocase subunit SecG